MKRGIILPLLAVALCALSCSDDESTAPVSLDMQDAIDKVKEDILPDIVPAGAKYQCVRMDGSLAEGTIIAEDTPAMQGGGRAPGAVLALSEESYLFYLDLAPNSYYAHPVKYVVVGKSGKHQVTEAQWWPLVGGATYPEFMKGIPDADHVIDGNVTLVAASGVALDFNFANLATQFPDGFIPVQGLLSGEALFDDAQATYANMANFCLAYRDKTFNTLVNGLVQGDADGIFGAIDGMVTAGKNVITIMIIAHGSVDGIRLGGYGFSAAQFVDKFNDYPSVHFNVLLGSCHSGSFLDDMQGLANVETFHAACASSGGATPDWDQCGALTDYNATDSGSEWFSSVLAAGGHILANATYWSTIQTMARSAGAPPASMLVHEMCIGACGNLPTMGLSHNLDLANVCGETIPQGYAKWEAPGR